MQEVVLSLDERGRHGARTTIVKVHGHTGEPLHAVADAMATEGAERKTEVDERGLGRLRSQGFWIAWMRDCGGNVQVGRPFGARP